MAGVATVRALLRGTRPAEGFAALTRPATWMVSSWPLEKFVT